jgi:hypothetical protein
VVAVSLDSRLKSVMQVRYSAIYIKPFNFSIWENF